MEKTLKIIISGGGTGGHIFPAISIANAIRKADAEADILFVGAEGRMEMQRVPEAGYPIIGLPVAGFDRKNLFRNIPVLFKLLKSQYKAAKIIRDFAPDVVVGVGGYASGPVLKVAGMRGIPTLIQEQNSYAGITNKLLAKRAMKICVAYEGMEKFFPADKILLTGNPVRQDLLSSKTTREEALKGMGLSPDKKTILILGGSLGARSINQCVMSHTDEIKSSGVQFIWQTGKVYYPCALEAIKAAGNIPNLYTTDFIKDMAGAYKAADLVVSRAGAGSISEFCLLRKAVILVPSPNVAEDHQTKNAMALVDKGAAICVKDSEVNDRLLSVALETIGREDMPRQLSDNIGKLALPGSSGIIAREIFRLAHRDVKNKLPDMDSIRSVYFIGAGGIGMSALARYFLSKGKFVAGYDLTPTELTETLTAEGARIHYEDSVLSIPVECKDNQSTLVVLTPAVPDEHSELQYFSANGFEIRKRAELLGIISRSGKALCVAGTHGKTTTSTMIAHLLYQSNIGCAAFLGGISKNYHTNLLLSENSPYIVIEADEFDRSFHWLTPHMSVITSVEPDHLDIYGTEEAYVESFRKYTSLIQPGGCLILKEGAGLRPDVRSDVKVYSYSKNKGDFHAENIRIGNGEITFDLIAPDARIDDIKLGVPVSINIENGVAASAIAWLNGVTAEEIKKGMESFRGVDRRFDFKIKSDRLVFLSDYAHHPSEIKESLSSLRELYPGRRITAVFQPHLYTRTRDFYKEFAENLSLADEVILLDIYPAREEPISGVSSRLIYENLYPDTEKSMVTKQNIVATLADKKVDVLITLGAGDIEDYVPAITQILKER